MNDLQFANVQVARMKANDVIPHLDAVCRDCKSKEKCKREMQCCSISQARMRIAIASRILSEIIDRRKEQQK